MTFRRFIGAFMGLSMLATLGVACSDGVNTAACATTIVEIKPSPPAPKPPAPKPPAPKPSGGTGGTTGTKTAPPAPKPGTKASPSTAPKPKITSSGTGTARKVSITPPGEKAYTPPSPKVKPSTADTSKVRDSAPKAYTTTGGYTSPVTNHYYVYHQPDYFYTALYLSAFDLYNPYDPFNHYYRPYSPFFGMPYLVGTSCGDGGNGNEIKPTQAEFDALEAKVSTVEAKLDAGQTDQLDQLDNDSSGTTTTTAPTTTTSS